MLVVLPVDLCAQDIVRLSPFSSRVTGQSTLTFTTLTTDDGTQTSNQSAHNLDAVSSTRGYLWKPWFSSLSLTGTAGAGRATQRASDSSDITTNTLSGNGSARITFFPTSWFPTTATFGYGIDVADSNSQERTQSVQKTFLLQHDYQGRNQWEPDIAAAYSFRQTESSQGGEGSPEQTVESFDVTLSKNLAGRELLGSFEWLRDRDTENDDSRVSRVLQAEHDYTAEWGANFNDFASFVEIDDNGQEIEIQQYSNSYSYRLPRDIRATSAFRYARTQRLGTADRQKTTALAFSGSVSKAFDNGWRTAATTQYRHDDTANGIEEEALLDSVTSYNIGDLEFYGWKGNFNFSGSAGYAFGEEDDRTGPSLSTSVGHGWAYVLPEREGLTDQDIRFNQFVSSTLASPDDSEQDGEVSITQALNYRAEGPAIGSFFAQLSDRRILNGRIQENQRLQLVLDREFWTSSRGGFSGAWTGFLVRNLREDDEEVAVGAAGVLRYSQNNFLQVRNLRYFATGTMDINKQLKGDDEDDPTVRTYSLQNGVTWVFGRLALRGRVFYERTESGENSTDTLGTSLTITRRWDSL